MCGIIGFCDYNKKSDFDILSNMTDTLIHRGPDDKGCDIIRLDKAFIGFGHRRLSVIDLSELGHQPMSFDGLSIVYNGEVYNFQEIKKELESLGYDFASHSDTEVILKAYHKWGIRAVDKFNGMFAIAIFDRAKNKITLIRDRAGVKPLYYHYDSANGLFMFASELKVFHKNPYFHKNINMDALALFFKFGYILEPYSIFENTFKLKAGHWLEFDINKCEISINKYWDVFDYYNKEKSNLSFDEAKTHVKNLLKSACEYRMIADVPVGVFLSGGYDSSTVAALLQQDRAQKIKTFSIGFHEEKYNEAPYAKEVAKCLGTDHTEYYCTKKEALDILPTIPQIWDEPFGDSSAIPTILVSKLAQEQVTVALSADGGDEIFGGYSKYTTAQKLLRIRNMPLVGKIVGNLLKDLRLNALIPRNSLWYYRYEKIYNCLLTNKRTDILPIASLHFFDNEIKKLFIKKPSALPTNFDNSNLNEQNDFLDKIMAIDYKTYQLDDILTKVDRATMSVSLESREPLLDYRVIEFVATLPNHYKINGTNKKYILKSIAHDLIPQSLLDRPKQGFAIPIKDWLAGDLKEIVFDELSEENIKKMGILDYKYVNKLKNNLSNDYYTTKVWFLLMFSLWQKQWLRR
nr:asparagine synthase (glutamine-hydrolyzing) [Campylobacter sp.]